MQALTKALIAGGVVVVGGIGVVIGRIWGKSESETRIQEFVAEIQSLHEVNIAREKEIALLRVKLDALAGEIQALKSSGGFFKRFVHWVGKEAPEVAERFRAMEEAGQRWEDIRAEQRRDAEKMDARVKELQNLYPKEMKKFESDLNAASKAAKKRH